MRTILFAAGLSFALLPTAFAGEHEADEEKRDEDDRIHVSGTAAGSLATPIVLRDEAALEKLCRDVQSPRSSSESEDRSVLRENRRSAMRNVYSAVVAPGGFKVGEFRHRGSRLPLRLEHPFTTLDGALRLIVVQRAGGSFELPATEAAVWASAIEEKRASLEVLFRIDHAMSDSLAPCFSYPKSATFAFNVEPLAYTLVENGGQKRRVETKTPALAKLKEWMEPGKARLSIVATTEGPIDGPALTQAIEAKRTELEACFGTMMQSAAATGVVAYEASVTPQGAFSEVRVEAESLRDSEAGPCAAKVLALVGAPKAKKASRAHVAFNIVRGDDDLVLAD